MRCLQNSGFTASDWIQVILAAITFLAVLVALFQARFWNWFDRPKLKAEFDRDSERCFRWAIVSGLCNIQDEGQFKDVKKYYFRLKIQNTGSAVRNLRARADILDKSGRPLDRFEPTTLNWINSQEKIDLARGESEYVNLISQVVSHPNVKNRVTVEVRNISPRGIGWDRPLKPYIFEVTLYGDNIKPEKISFAFKPNKDTAKPGTLEKN